MIGSTPMVEVTQLDTGPCRLFVKLESQNPGGSIKDRIALSMIEAAERDGRLEAGRHRSSRRPPAIPASAWRWSRAQKGYRLMLVVPDKMSREKILHLRALGAEVRMTRSDVGKGHPEYYQDMADTHRRRDPGRLLRQPVRQSRPIRWRTRRTHRPGDLGAAGRMTSTPSSSASARAAR